MPIKRRSAKAKGSRGQTELRVKLLQNFPQLEPDDVVCAVGSQNGTDIKLSPAARRIIPYSFEVKYREKLNIWEALNQAENNTIPNTDPAVVFKRNRSETFIALKLDDFLKLIKK